LVTVDFLSCKTLTIPAYMVYHLCVNMIMLLQHMFQLKHTQTWQQRYVVMVKVMRALFNHQVDFHIYMSFCFLIK